MNKITLIIAMLFIVGCIFANFSYLSYLTPAEANSVTVERFVHNSMNYTMIIVNGKAMFLIKTLANKTDLLVNTTNEIESAIDTYASLKINFSESTKASIKAQMRDFNASLHSTVKVMSIEFKDPLFDCGRQFGIDVYKGSECTTLKNCKALISVYCAARPGFCPDIDVLSNALYNFENAARNLISNIEDFDKNIDTITKDSPSFKVKATELITIVENIESNTKTLKNSVLRYPASGNINECRDCYGVCPAVPGDLNILTKIKSVINLWKQGYPDTEIIKTFLLQGIERVKKKELEKISEKLKKELADFEMQFNIDKFLKQSSELLNQVDDPQFIEPYNALIKAKTEAESAANLASEEAFRRAIANYQEAYLNIQNYNFSQFTDQLATIQNNNQEIFGLLFYIKYAEDEMIQEYSEKVKVISQSTVLPISAKSIEKIIQAQEAVKIDLQNRIYMLKTKPEKVATSNYFATALTLAQPIVDILFSKSSLTAEQTTSLTYGTMWLITAVIIFATVCFVVLVFMIIWYGWLRTKQGKSLPIKIAFVFITLFAIGLIVVIETVGSISMHSMVTKANLLDYLRAVQATKNIIVIVNSSSKDVFECANNTLNILNKDLKNYYLFDANTAKCYANGVLGEDTAPCVNALKKSLTPILIMSEGASNQTSFSLIPRPLATITYETQYYKICVPKTVFTYT